MKLWLDDLRQPPREAKNWSERSFFQKLFFWQTYYKKPYEWEWVKTTVGMKYYLMTHKVDVISLDNDLGPGPSEGYTVLDWLEQNPQHMPKEIFIHTANPVARKRMEQIRERLIK